MKKALIVIDYTIDFVATDGALTCGIPGQEIAGKLLDVVKLFTKNKDEVVFAVDVHDENDPFHPETKLFPPHNLRGTKGRDLYGELQAFYDSNKHLPNVHYLDKTRYSAFTATGLDVYLRSRNVDEVHLVGVCTDICVLHTAVEAYNLGYKISVYPQAVASFNPQGHEWALTHFQHTLGAKLLTL